MQVLVIGGSGFIGTRLISVLVAERGHSVVNLDLEPSSAHPGLTILGDIRSPSDMVSACRGRDVVVNLAAVHRDDVRPLSLYHETNVEGARVLTEAMTAAGVTRLVFTSSVAVYGLDVNHPDESTEPNPFNAYGRTKLAAEGVYRSWAAAQDDRSLTVVRPCVVFGESNRGNVHTLAHQIQRRRFLLVGDGANRKSMAYVGNIVELLADRVESADRVDSATRVETINYADKPDMTTKELVAVLALALTGKPPSRARVPVWLVAAGGRFLDLAARVTGRTLSISSVRIQKFFASTTVDTTLLESTGFRPRYTLQEGLARTIAADFPTGHR